MTNKSDITYHSIYPLTIFHTRYNGTYEGGLYVALNERYEDVPLEATGSDVPCGKFYSNPDLIYGFGRTPDDAANALLKAMIAKGYDGDELAFNHIALAQPEGSESP